MAKILYGECVSARDKAEVRICALGDKGCRLEADTAVRVFDTDFSLWIGAVGPIPAVATRKDAGHVAVRFKEPLDERILEHFNG